MKKILKFDYNALSLPIIAAYMSLAFIFSDFGVSAVLGGAFLCLWTFICFLSFVFVKKGKLRDFKAVHWLIIGFIAVIGVNVLRNFKFDRDLIYYCLVLTTGCVLFVISSPVSKRVLNVTKYILFGVATLFSFVNVLHFYFPGFVRSIMFKLISQHSIKYNNHIFGEGYGFAFGSSIGMTACLIAFGLMLVWFDFSFKKWKTHIPLLILLSFGLFSIQRRGELTVWFIAIAIVSIIRLIKNKKLDFSVSSQLKLIAVTLACVLIGFAIFVLTTNSNRFDISQYITENEDMDGMEFDVEKYSNGRLILWDLAIDSFLEKPILGHGWRAYAEIGPLSGDPRALDAHNVYFQLLCETGIVGFILIGTVFVSLLIILIKKIVKTKNLYMLKRYIIGICILLAMLGFGVIDNSLYINHWIQIFQMMLFFVFSQKKLTGENQITD